jgi:hypothetical protein
MKERSKLRMNNAAPPVVRKSASQPSTAASAAPSAVPAARRKDRELDPALLAAAFA